MLVLALILASQVVRTDSWPPPVIKEVFSASRDWFVRVTPGKSLGDTVGFAGSPKGPYATAEFYRRQPSDRSYRLQTTITLLNPVAPVDFLVTDRGYLVTFDNWHNRGYGQVVASYSPAGKTAASYALKDLFTPDEIGAFVHSVSSIPWRAAPLYVREGQQSVHAALDDHGRALILVPETGAWQQCEWRGDRHLCRDTNERRTWRAYREPLQRK